jgi:hypothetical protein
VKENYSVRKNHTAQRWSTIEQAEKKKRGKTRPCPYPLFFLLLCTWQGVPTRLPLRHKSESEYAISLIHKENSETEKIKHVNKRPSHPLARLAGKHTSLCTQQQHPHAGHTRRHTHTRTSRILGVLQRSAPGGTRPFTTKREKSYNVSANCLFGKGQENERVGDAAPGAETDPFQQQTT